MELKTQACLRVVNVVIFSARNCKITTKIAQGIGANAIRGIIVECQLPQSGTEYAVCNSCLFAFVVC